MVYLVSMISLKGWHYQKKKSSETVSEKLVNQSISILNRPKTINGIYNMEVIQDSIFIIPTFIVVL